jgi:1,4-alpha-glucan branching enzyme
MIVWRDSMKLSNILVVLALMVVSCGKYLDERIDSPVTGDTGVTFRYRVESARTVQLAGDWNNWGQGDAGSGEILEGLMEDRGEGLWELTVELRPGRYRYFFIVDEVRVVVDPENPRTVDDNRGGKASLLIVP